MPAVPPTPDPHHPEVVVLDSDTSMESTVQPPLPPPPPGKFILLLFLSLVCSETPEVRK